MKKIENKNTYFITFVNYMNFYNYYFYIILYIRLRTSKYYIYILNNCFTINNYNIVYTY